MPYLLVPSPRWSTVVLTGRTASGQSFQEVVAASTVPGLASLMLGAIGNVRSGNTSTKPVHADARELMGVYQDSTLTPWVSKTTRVVPFETVRHPNRDFRDRLQAGDIVVAPYFTGQLEITTRSQGAVPSGTVPTQTSFQFGYFDLVSTWGVALPTSAKGTVTSAAVMVKYEQYYFATSTIFRSPAVTPQALPAITFDTSLIMRVAADNNQASYDVMTELAELPSTINYLTDRSSKMAQLHKKFTDKRSRLNRFPLARRLKKLAQLELEFRYALQPLVLSFTAIREQLADYIAIYKSSRGRERHDSRVPFSTSAQYIELVGEDTHRCFAKSKFDPVTFLSQLRARLGANLIPTLWELTPWSFVADWFANIGDVLNVLFASTGASQQVWQYSVQADSTWHLAEGSDQQYPRTTVRHTSYERVIINPIDHIGLTLSADLTFLQSLDGLALVINRALKDIRS